ncbi:MAG: TraB/GumN family protein [Xanthomonadales bacterium]|nr:TraB/GumN family protein [Xanthomonadales bacterium]
MISNRWNRRAGVLLCGWAMWAMLSWTVAGAAESESTAAERVVSASSTDDAAKALESPSPSPSDAADAVPGPAAVDPAATVAPDRADAGDASAATAKSLDTVVVEGVMPGPGLWQVKKGDHTLWVLGQLTPSPKKLEWRGDEVQGVLDRAGVLIYEPSVTVGTNLGFWGTLTLAPKALGVRKDPEKETLKEQLTPETYARWSKLKHRYMGDKRSIEKLRPIFAADRLVKSAERRSGLTRDRWVSEQVGKWAKRREVPSVSPGVRLTIEDPKQMLGEFKDNRLDDVACFESVLDWLERDLERMRQKANAWAVGDVEMLRELSGESPRLACVKSVIDSDMFRNRGFENLPERAREAWLEAVDQALSDHETSLAILSIEELVSGSDYLAALTARGYEVIAPE